MRLSITDNGFKCWLSARDTYAWAHRPGRRWPCSELSDRRVFCEYDAGGLVDLSVDGRDADVSSDELTACVGDHVLARLPADHPTRCYFDDSEEA